MTKESIKNYVIKFIKKIIYCISIVLMFICMYITIIPWISIGSVLYFLRWLFLDKSNGVDIYILGPMTISILASCIFEERLGLSDSNSFHKTTLWKEIKKEYNEKL